MFTETGWKKLRSYLGDDILTRDHTGVASLNGNVKVRGIRDVKGIDCLLYRSQRIDLCAGLNSDLSLENGNGGITIPVHTVKTRLSRTGAITKGYVPTEFRMREDKNEAFCNMDPYVMKVAIMINADGDYKPEMTNALGTYRKTANQKGHHVYRLRFKRERKIERCRMLLKASGLVWRESTTIQASGETLFYVEFPFFDAKHFPHSWIYLPQDKKEMFIKELLYWDGSYYFSGNYTRSKSNLHNAARVFYSTKKEDIDIAQMIAKSCGYGTLVRVSREADETRKTLYSLRISTMVGIKPKFTQQRSRAKGKEGMYANELKVVKRRVLFEVDAGEQGVLMRRGGDIFICLPGKGATL